MADESDSAEATPSATAAAEATQPLALPPMLAPGSNADGTQDGDPGDWQPPQVDKNGFAIDPDGLPVNLRLRGLELARRGEKEDPNGHVAPAAIADAGERLAAHEKKFPALDGMTKDALLKAAKKENVAVPDGALRDDIQAAIEAARPALI